MLYENSPVVFSLRNRLGSQKTLLTNPVTCLRVSLIVVAIIVLSGSASAQLEKSTTLYGQIWHTVINEISPRDGKAVAVVDEACFHEPYSWRKAGEISSLLGVQVPEMHHTAPIDQSIFSESPQVRVVAREDVRDTRDRMRLRLTTTLPGCYATVQIGCPGFIDEDLAVCGAAVRYAHRSFLIMYVMSRAHNAWVIVSRKKVSERGEPGPHSFDQKSSDYLVPSSLREDDVIARAHERLNQAYLAARQQWPNKAGMINAAQAAWLSYRDKILADSPLSSGSLLLQLCASRTDELRRLQWGVHMLGRRSKSASVFADPSGDNTPGEFLALDDAQYGMAPSNAESLTSRTLRPLSYFLRHRPGRFSDPESTMGKTLWLPLEHAVRVTPHQLNEQKTLAAIVYHIDQGSSGSAVQPNAVVLLWKLGPDAWSARHTWLVGPGTGYVKDVEYQLIEELPVCTVSANWLGGTAVTRNIHYVVLKAGPVAIHDLAALRHATDETLGEAWSIQIDNGRFDTNPLKYWFRATLPGTRESRLVGARLRVEKDNVQCLGSEFVEPECEALEQVGYSGDQPIQVEESDGMMQKFAPFSRRFKDLHSTCWAETSGTASTCEAQHEAARHHMRLWLNDWPLDE